MTELWERMSDGSICHLCDSTMQPGLKKIHWIVGKEKSRRQRSNHGSAHRWEQKEPEMLAEGWEENWGGSKAISGKTNSISVRG